MAFKSNRKFSLPRNLQRRPIDFGKSTIFLANSSSLPQLYAINSQSKKKDLHSFGSYIDRQEVKLPLISPYYQKTEVMSNRNQAKPQPQPQQQLQQQQQQQNKGKTQLQNGTKESRFPSPASTEARRVKRELWWKESESQKKVDFPGKPQFDSGPKINPWNNWTPSKSEKKIESRKLVLKCKLN
jgi:hypothetical protein